MLKRARRKEERGNGRGLKGETVKRARRKEE
jgi:hypothetical protein